MQNEKLLSFAQKECFQSHPNRSYVSNSIISFSFLESGSGDSLVATVDDDLKVHFGAYVSKY